MARKERPVKGRDGAKLVSLLGLAPGTPFMGRVEEALQFWACQRLSSYKHRNLSIEISGATVPVGTPLLSYVSVSAVWVVNFI